MIHHRMAKIKNSDTTKFWWRCGQTGSLICILLVGMQNDLATLVDCMRFLKTKHATIIWPNNGALGHLSQRNEDRLIQKPGYECLE